MAALEYGVGRSYAVGGWSSSLSPADCEAVGGRGAAWGSKGRRPSHCQWQRYFSSRCCRHRSRSIIVSIWSIGRLRVNGLATPPGITPSLRRSSSVAARSRLMMSSAALPLCAD
eukprot:TRINITY_DN32094_c0_g1_i1.p2 TRINITY_DN32094_c0_g1~~TRINITY_DN32094_c0_g1_i1.p2  ORF type:complete len:114 (-),score=2.08 TRINITY_DN32094_c0_g1_i1:85-426(-)